MSLLSSSLVTTSSAFTAAFATTCGIVEPSYYCPRISESFSLLLCLLLSNLLLMASRLHERLLTGIPAYHFCNLLSEASIKDQKTTHAVHKNGLNRNWGRARKCIQFTKREGHSEPVARATRRAAKEDESSSANNDSSGRKEDESRASDNDKIRS